jgi:hypothetical protein
MQGILEILKQVPNIINNAFGGLGGIIVTIFAIEGAVTTFKFVVNTIKKHLSGREENEEEEEGGDFDVDEDDEIIEIGDAGGFYGIDDYEDMRRRLQREVDTP